MSEAELVQGLLGSIQVVISVFSMFFAMTSAYIAGLYFFLNRAPLSLRLLAYLLLSIGLLFLGGSAAVQQRLQENLFAAMGKLPNAVVAVDALRNPIAVSLPQGLSLQEVGIAIGWATALSVYLALGYLTFFYHWRAGPRLAELESRAAA
jgi:hypothetical protein